MNNDKMLGDLSRVCDDRFCTCNEGQTKNRRKDKRTAKRRERQEWKKNLSNM